MNTVIVGAGLQGICTAYFLARQGVAVTVLEQEAGPGLGASYANGGYVQADCPETWNIPGLWRALPSWWWASLRPGADYNAMLVRTRALPGLVGWGVRFLRNCTTRAYHANTLKNYGLAKYSQQMLAEIREREGFDYHASQRGALFICRNASELEAYKPLLEYMSAHGSQGQLLSRDELLGMESSLDPIGDKLCGAVKFPGDEAGDAHIFCRELTARAISAGAKIEYGVTVNRLRQRPNGFDVSTDQGTYSAEKLVLAAGCWTPHIAQTIGLPVPVVPAKGCSLTIDVGAWATPPKHVVCDMGVHAGISVLDGRLRVAGTAEFAGYDNTLTTAREAYLVTLVESVFPEFAKTMDRDKLNGWSGLRPLSADGLPLLGETKVPGLYLNTGHGGLGWTQSAGSGKALADTMTGTDGGYDLSAFDPGRTGLSVTGLAGRATRT